MRILSKIFRTLTTVTLILLPAAAALGNGSTGAVLGSDGELYRLVSSTYGELTGASSAADADDPVLALLIQQADGTSELKLVPETVGPEVENSPFVIFENASRTVFLAWEERTNHIHSRIRLIGYQGGEWSEVLDVSEGSFGFKGQPRLAATRDSFVVAGAGEEPVTVSRTILHVVWVEERAEGQLVAYAPVTLIDGHHAGERQIFDLSTMVANAEGAPADLWELVAPMITAADNDHSVMVGLVDPKSGRIVSLQIGVLPGELSVLADELRSHLIDIGARHEWQSPEGLRRLADELRSHLIDIGYRLDPQILRHVADGLRSHLIDVGVSYSPSDLSRLAGDLRSHLIDVGFRLDDRGLRRVTSASSVRVVLEVAGMPDPTTPMPAASHVAQVTVVDGWERPSEATSDSILLLSRNGQEALLSWSTETSVFYRETFGGEWSTVHRLPIGRGLNADEALAILQNRIRNR